MKRPRHTFGKRCTSDGCPTPALVLSDPPSCPNHIADFEEWISRVEREPDTYLSALARESYVMIAEDFGPVSSRFYHKAAGEPPPNVAYRLTDPLVFCALAAASGVIGNVAYDALKALVGRLIGTKRETLVEEKITSEFYERVRTEIHGADPPKNQLPEFVKREVELKHRLIIEKPKAKKP